MNLLLKYKDKIVSFGLLPIIITLIGIHLFPTTAMLGTGLTISIAGLLYDVLRLKGLNFFLLQGTIGIGVCFLLRLFTGYEYIPKNSLTPSLEFMLLICAFIHVTAPEIYRNFLKKFHLNFTSSYLLEAKIIVIFSSIHLIILFFLYNKLIPFSPENNFGIIYLIPTLIYVICLVINIVGIQIAATQSPREQHIIRIVPICNGKIYLTPHAENTTIWDAPIKTLFNGQSFAFHGYLPIEPADRMRRLKELEARVYSENQTQLFIETPYRNHKMLEDILKTCPYLSHLIRQ